MYEVIKGFILPVAITLSVGAISVAIKAYVDVQLLKNVQDQHKGNFEKQDEMFEQVKEVLNRLDKTIAVQNETIKALSEAVKELRRANSGGQNVNRN